MKNVILLITSFCIVAFSYSQPGSNDSSFNPIDIGVGNGDGFNYDVFATSIQSDGKILFGGRFTGFNEASRYRIARLNIDGSLDSSFDPGFGFDRVVNSIVIQSDGKIVVGGDFFIFAGIERSRIARLNANGSIDISFDPRLGFDRVVNSIAIQADGKMIVGGEFTSFDGVEVNRIVRLNANGSLDNSFHLELGFNHIVHSIAIQTDSKIIVGGQFTAFNGIETNRIARLNSDGSLDNTFDIGIGFNGNVSSTFIQADGKIIVAGNFTSFAGIERSRIARLNSDGSLDTSFNPGTGFNNVVLSTTLQSDNKIIVGGDFTEFNGIDINRIARLNADGSLDVSFDTGTGFDHTVTTIAIQIDDKIILGGDFYRINGNIKRRVARLNSNGSLDRSFNLGSGFDDIVQSIAIQPDDKIIAGGGFTSFNGIERKGIARLNADGSLDNSFNIGDGFNNTVSSIALQTDGKILVGGDFTSFDGIEMNYFARLNTDGSLDQSFNLGTGFDRSVSTIVVQEDGKIFVGGNFRIFNGLSCNYITRLNTDGSLDDTFDPGTGFSGSVMTITIQSDNKIIVGGRFTSYNGISRRRIARLNTDGSLDMSFNPGTGFDHNVTSTTIQTDGKIIVLGWFMSFNGVGTNFIARLNIDGSLDESFNQGSGFSGYPQTTIIQEDGKIVVVGVFNSYNGISRRKVARLNIDGSLDMTFNSGYGFNSTVNSIATQSDGNFIVGGSFTYFSGIGRNRIARLFGGDCETTTGTDIIFACDSYIWIDGNTYTENNNTATHTLTNVIGCDSVVTLNLTMNTGVSDRSTTINDATITANNISATYTWLDCDNNFAVIPGETSRSFTATANGNYAVSLRENGCVEISDCVAITILSIIENEFAKNLTLYPNPTQGNFSVDLGEIYKEVRLSIFDLNGKLVHSNFLQNTQVMSVSMEVPSGVYLINIQADGKKAVLRLVKE